MSSGVLLAFFIITNLLTLKAFTASDLEDARLLTKVLTDSTVSPYQAASYWKRILVNPYFARNPQLLQRALPSLWHRFAPEEVVPLIQKPMAFIPTYTQETLFSLPIEPLSSKEREALADTYLFLVKHLPSQPYASEIEKAFFRLYRDLPYTRAAKAVFQEPLPDRLLKLITPEDTLAKAQSLFLANDNQGVIDTLSPFTAALIEQLNPPKENPSLFSSPTQQLEMEAIYLMAKTYRRLRDYKQATRYFQIAYEHLTGDKKRFSLYMLSRLAIIQNTPEALPLMTQYISFYQKDPNTADVLLWKYNFLLAQRDNSNAEQALLELQKLFPSHPFLEEAQMSKVFDAVENDRVETALTILKKLKSERARYWHARLLLFPHINLIPNTNLSEAKQGKKELLEVAMQFQSHYYGTLARGLLRLKKLPSGSHPVPRVSPATDKDFSKNPYLQAVRTMSSPETQEAASFLLDSLSESQMTSQDKILLAQLYAQNKQLHKAHHLMRSLGFITPLGSPSSHQLFWQYVYPKAFSQAIETAAKEANISSQLLFALAREESRFTDDIISWAGAIGLCQLMPSTAKEEALFLKEKNYEKEAILDAQLNAKLGATHLAKGIRQLEHPLLGIAAYNAGVFSVKKWLNQDSRVTALDFFTEKIPFEQTRNYVKKVSNSWAIYQLLYEDDFNLPWELSFKRKQ